MTAAQPHHAFAVEILTGLGVGLVVLAPDSRVVFANQVAELILKSCQGLTISGGRLRPQDRSQMPAFRRIISEVSLTRRSGRRAGLLISVPRAASRPLPLLVSRLRSLGDARGALVIFSDPETRPTPCADILSTLYRLTAAEGRLLSAVLAGETLAEYADRTQISRNTVKSQMRQVLQKTGQARQVDLVRAIVADPVVNLAAAWLGAERDALPR
jgi:DNA-binding CsgD family transcriptional regulator